MLIVLDTNVLHRDPHLDGARLRLLREGARTLGATIVLPQVVIEELRRQAQEDVVSHIAAAEDAAYKLNRLARYSAMAPPRPDLAEAVMANLNTWFDHLSAPDNNLGIRVSPPPSVSHSDLALRAILRRRPFQEKGRGYVDALIWFTVLDLASKSDAPVVFITNNTKDFAGSDGTLHSDLLEDLTRRGHSATHIELLPTVESFNKKYVLSQLRPATRLMFELEEDKHSGMSIRQWAVDHLADTIAPHYLFGTALDDDEANEDIDIIKHLRVLQVHRARVDKALQLGEVGFLLTVSISCRLAFRIEYPPRFIRGQRGRHGPTETLDLPGVEVERTDDVTVVLSMILNADATVVQAADLVGMEGRHGEMELEEDDEEQNASTDEEIGPANTDGGSARRCKIR